MKYSINWHEQNLVNFQTFTKRKRNELDKLQAEVHSLEKDLAFLGQQIIEEKMRGLTEFDHERFLVIKKKVCTNE